MNKSKHLQSFALIFLILFLFKTIGNSQVAICKSQVTVSTNPFSCTYTLLPSDINNGSLDYDVLSIDKTNLTELGTHVVTLTASKNNGQSSSCVCNVNLVDKGAPIAIGKLSIVVGFTEQNYFDLLPFMVDNGSYDYCSAVSLSVSPTVIDCNSPNPLPAVLTVTDASGNTNQVITMVNIVQNKNRIKEIVCKGDITFGVPPVGNFEITADSLLQGGPYACPSFYSVVLKYNNITLPAPFVGPTDIGKTFDYTVTDPETQNICTGTITIVGLDCAGAFNVCDTSSRCTSEGDCNSGHTLSDDIEWPCDITVADAPSYLLTDPTPQIIADFLNMPLSDVKPMLFNGVSQNNKCLVISEEIQTEVVPTENKIIFTYSYSNYADTNNIVHSYQQTITLIPTTNLACEVCDYLPWNTPFGACASGHTENDAVEWPADITVDFTAVSPHDLSQNPLVNPNDASPILNVSCTDIWSKTYEDVISQIMPSVYLVSRAWTIVNNTTNQSYSYTQEITINALTNNNRHVCFATLKDEPISEVVIMDNIVSGVEGCNSIIYNGSTDKIKPFRNDTDFNAGLDIEDIIMMKEYVFQVRPLDELEQENSDMNNDGIVNNLDVNIMSSLLNKNSNSTSHHSSPWWFLDANKYYSKNDISDFADITSPFENYEFIGLKLGDLNSSYLKNEVLPIATTFTLNDQLLYEGQDYDVKFFTKEPARFKGFQMAITKNEAFEILNVIGVDVKIQMLDQGDHYLLIGIAEDSDIIGNGITTDPTLSIFKITIKAKSNVVLHDILDLSTYGNLWVEGYGKPNTNITLNYNGSIPVSASDIIDAEIAIYPNPTTGLISIVAPDNTVNEVKIISMDGKLIFTSLDVSSRSIDISHLPNSIYTLNLSLNNGKTMVKKLIKL